MNTGSLNGMIKGWFIGNFEPSVYKTSDVEVAVKKYNKEDKEQRHYHRIATEITVVIYGKVMMNGSIYKDNDIITIKPLESTNFHALEDTVTVVVKLPGAVSDKYLDKCND